MMKRLVSAAALSVLVAGAALAQAPAPATDAPAAQAGPETTAPAAVDNAPGTTTEAATPAPAETGSIAQQTESGAPTETATPDAETAAVPDSVDSCIAAAADLGSSAESKTLSPDNADHLDVLFSKMETLCDGEKFAEAVGVANDIRSIINAN
jgi:hypothetical protein